MKKLTRVTGFGGVFFKAKNEKKLRSWYQKHLGLPLDPNWGGWSIEWREAKAPHKKGTSVWSVFPRTKETFSGSKQEFMINYRVKDLKKLLTALKREGVWIDPKVEDTPYGKFAWIKDAEGNRIELWEPPRGT
ncbi:MAG TPA: VOC family protein [Candidatus Didemnitutus sp.]|nr:VOC family protein [Candidatus Didemnitutus sp.]